MCICKRDSCVSISHKFTIDSSSAYISSDVHLKNSIIVCYKLRQDTIIASLNLSKFTLVYHKIYLQYKYDPQITSSHVKNKYLKSP